MVAHLDRGSKVGALVAGDGAAIVTHLAISMRKVYFLDVKCHYNMGANQLF